MKTFQKPLTSGEEARYIRLLQEGNEEEAREARNILIERNMRLVAHIAKKYQNVEEDMEDLISIGCIGLIKAINTFDAGKGRLATYACRCIDNELLMLLRSKKKTSREVSLFEPIGQDKEGNEIHLVDIIEQQQIDIVDRMEFESNLKKLFSLLEECLTEREKEIIIMRFGLSGQPDITQSEIGSRLGISRSYSAVIIGIKPPRPAYCLPFYPFLTKSGPGICYIEKARKKACNTGNKWYSKKDRFRLFKKGGSKTEPSVYLPPQAFCPGRTVRRRGMQGAVRRHST